MRVHSSSTAPRIDRGEVKLLVTIPGLAAVTLPTNHFMNQSDSVGCKQGRKKRGMLVIPGL